MTPYMTHCLEIGSAGGSPAPVGDPPTGTAESNLGKRPYPLARTVTPIPSGESPDGTGGAPVPPKTDFSKSPKKREGQAGFFPSALTAAVNPRAAPRHSLAPPVRIHT